MRSRDLFDKRREPSLERPRKFSRLICRAGFCGLLISVHLGILEKNVYEIFHILLGCRRNHGRPCRPHRPSTRTRADQATAGSIQVGDQSHYNRDHLGWYEHRGKESFALAVPTIRQVNTERNTSIPQIALGIRFSSAARRLASKSMVSLND